VDPELPEGSAEEVRRAAVRIFEALDGYGLSRVDFFVTAEGKVIFNEINTMPGFTSISMYPMLFEARGKDKKALVKELMELALEREA
jgi:D-alanine--D-alanine ligase